MRSSSMTTRITRDCRVCFATVEKTTHRNQRGPAKLHMRHALVVTQSSLRIRRVSSVRSAIQTRKVERSSLFHHCGVLMSDSITQSMPAPRVRLVTGETAVGLVYQSRRD
jgi:hypothetical protein